jgi:uncharacterized protein (TIGR03083 family)
MEIAEHIGAVAAHGPALLAAGQSAGLAAGVPACPGWTVADLLAHIGGVHRWAASYVASGREREATAEEAAPCFSVPPGEPVTVWARHGYERLLQALEQAPADLACWTFLPAPSSLAFWARRQAHETAVHRVDAEAAAGRVAHLEADFAADGVDELLCGFFSRPRRPAATKPMVLAVEALDAPGRWRVTMGPEGIKAERGSGGADGPPPDGRLRGPAQDLYLLLWNRLTLEATGAEMDGDPAVLALWQQRARVR